jgi:prolipoprotein diacylglyceryltransferase
MNHFIIETANSELWFTLVFLSPILLVMGIFIFKGLRQYRSFLTMWLITVSGMLFFLIGIHLFPLSFEELKMVLITVSPVKQGEKSVLGGLLVIAGLVIAICWLKEKILLVDNLAVPFMIGVGLQNIGCHMAGCCYGNPSSLPWSIQYGVHSPVFVHEFQNGLVKTGETASLPVHPVKLYLLFGCLLLAFITWRYQRRWKAPLSSFIFAWVLYSVLRFRFTIPCRILARSGNKSWNGIHGLWLKSASMAIARDRPDLRNPFIRQRVHL